MAVAEHVAWEMSEPGTGPMPVYQSPEKDKDIANGWRRESPLAAYSEYADPFMNPIFITLPELPWESEGVI